MKEVTVNGNDAGQRLDKFLHKIMPSLPDSMLHKGLRKNCVRINGTHAKNAAVMLKEGDVLRLYYKDEFFEREQDERFKALTPNIDVVYEDENIILVNKPQGLCVHEDESGSGATLIDYIKAYLWQRGEYRPEQEKSFAPALCNRIDRNTCGIVIAAKNAPALRVMNEKIKNREIEKYYICAVWGKMPDKEGELTAYLMKDEQKKQVYIYDRPKDGAKTIITGYSVILEGEQSSLLNIHLKTGRTHQIRAHLAHIGHPIIGDGKYGRGELNKRIGVFRQALCSYRLKFSFTSDGDVLEYLNGREFCIGKVPFEEYIR